MKYKKIPFYYDWDNIMSRLQNDDEYEDVTLELDDDILILKDMKEIPWCEFPDETPMNKTGMWVKDEGNGYVGYYIVYNGREIYYSQFKENYSKLINESKETYNFTLSTRDGRPLSQYGFYEISEEEVEIIKEMIDNEEVDELWDYLLQLNYPDICVIGFNIYYDSEDFLDYDLCDHNGNEIDSGKIRDQYKKVIKDKNDNCIVNKYYHPEYLLISMDMLKKGETIFQVPKDIDVHKIKFYDSNIIGDGVLWWEWFGERTLDIYRFSYKGKPYFSEEYNDNGSLGESHFGLFKWNGRRYVCISGM